MKNFDLALTFDDILIVPAYSSILPADVNLHTQLTKKIKLNIPLISAAMDSVTESAAAICIAQQGGLGVIHRNLSPEEQAKEVIAVKKHESGIINNPVTTHQESTVGEVMALMKLHRVSGIPVVSEKRVVGIVTSRDLRFEKNHDKPISKVMTSESNLITVTSSATNSEISSLLHKHRIEKLLVVDGNRNLRGLITVKDIQKSRDFPLACKDSQGHLLVGAAVGVGVESEHRVEQLTNANVDVIVVDTAHGHSQRVIDMVKYIKKKYDVQIIAGNIADAEAAHALIDAGADAVKVGIGPGSICTTRIVAGVGVPQVHAILQVAKAAHQSGIPLIADGGIRYAGDIAKALACGANSVMIGGLFAGTEESPGDIDIFKGRSYKSYRGMGSLGAMKKGSKDRYFQESVEQSDQLIPEGVEGRVPYRGSMVQIIHQLTGGVRAAMGYTGSANIADLKQAKMIRITSAGVREGHVHDVTIMKESPNYHQ